MEDNYSAVVVIGALCRSDLEHEVFHHFLFLSTIAKSAKTKSFNVSFKHFNYFSMYVIISMFIDNFDFNIHSSVLNYISMDFNI